MQELIPIAWGLLGIVTGTAGTIVGAGGGFILVPVLMMIDPTLPPTTVTAVSLAVVAANATSGSIAYALKGRVVWPFAAWFSIWSLPGAALGIWLVARVPRQYFAPVFAVLLIALALYAGVRSRGAEKKGHEVVLGKDNATKGALMSVGVGTLATFLGIGGGIVHVPLMVYWLQFPPHLATATSHVVLAVTALGSTAMHMTRGDLSGQWHRVIPLGLGMIVGAQIGAGLSTRVNGPWIMRVLAVGLIIVAVRLLLAH